MQEYIVSWKNRPNLNKNEHYKLAKDGLKILDDLPRFAKLTQKEMLASDVELLKWAGIYAQRPRDGHYLVRAKLPSGALTAAQARALAEISATYGRQTIQITDRQSIQIHWLELGVLADVVARLHAAGLTSTEACGDCPRNILGNPLMGVDSEETIDTEPLVRALVAKFQGNPAFSNLPRKFKISISANPHDVGFARINDIAFVPAKKTGATASVSTWAAACRKSRSSRSHCRFSFLPIRWCPSRKLLPSYSASMGIAKTVGIAA